MAPRLQGFGRSAATDFSNFWGSNMMIYIHGPALSPLIEDQQHGCAMTLLSATAGTDVLSLVCARPYD